MKKTLFTAALACALTVFGLALSAQDNPQETTTESHPITFKSTVSQKIMLQASGAVSDVNFAIQYNNGSEPVSLVAQTEGDPRVFALGQFKAGDTFQLGTVSNNEFVPFPSVLAEPGYYISIDENSFYSQDFSENPFNGYIEVLVMGEPLPASTVTLIVALAAGAAFLLYKNRKPRAFRAEQA